jgi:hypothetical protein
MSIGTGKRFNERVRCSNAYRARLDESTRPVIKGVVQVPLGIEWATEQAVPQQSDH